MTELQERGLFPFRLSWPKRPNDMIIVLAAHSAAERKAWVKAVDANIAAIAAAAPMAGYLMKKQGRMGGLLKFGWNNRWFELLQATEVTPASFCYYETEARGAAPKGTIVLNGQSMLMSSTALSLKGHEHVFAISSRGPDNKRPVTTVLAATSQSELEAWTSALERALHSFKPKTAPRTNLTEEEAALNKRTLAQLRLMLEYMGVQVDRACDDKGLLVTEVLRTKQILAIQKHSAMSTSSRELTKQLKKDEARLMQRSVDELRALLDYMEVEYDPAIDSKTRLVGLIISQKRRADAATSAQRIWRRASSHRSEGGTHACAEPPAPPVDVA